MWWTERGEQVLRGAEWELFRAGMGILWDWVEESFDDPTISSTGVEVFDRLEASRKLALLAQVGAALRDEKIPCPALTANTEATVAAVYRQIADEIAVEIDLAAEADMEGEPTHWRKLALAAYREAEEDAGPDPEPDPPVGAASTSGDDEVDDDDEWIPPDVTSSDAEEWEFLVVDMLAERVLWSDGDYLAEDDFLDVDPSEARRKKRLMGIAEDYYTAIAPEPTDEGLEEIRRTLRALCGRPEPVEPAMVEGLSDNYHNLLVGPCERESIEREADCPLIYEIAIWGEDGFDCAYDEWSSLLREDVRRAAEQDWPEVEAMMTPPPPELQAEASRAQETGMPLLLVGGGWIEPRESAWVVVDAEGEVLCDANDAVWSKDDGDPETPQRFDTPLAAWSAYQLSLKVAESRSVLRTAALKRLGRDA